MPGRPVPVLAATILALAAGCGSGSGGTEAKPTSTCSSSMCTVNYPAKERNNQDSMGGPGITVFGVDTALATIGQGAALLRVGSGPISLTKGETANTNGLIVKLVDLSPTQAVVTYTKG